MTKPLSDAWAKLEHAKARVNEIARVIPKSLEKGVYSLPLVREYKRDLNAVVVIVESVPELPENLGLLVGDVIHNFRSALDLAWWQLAVKHLKREPTEDEANSIQFPIRRPGKNLNTGDWAHWVGQDAVNIVEPEQPDKAWTHEVPTGPSFVPPTLGALRYLSNLAKHRFINATFLPLTKMVVPAIHADQFIDCLPDRSRKLGSPVPGLRPAPEQEIFRVPVSSAGRRADVDFNPQVFTQIAVEPFWRMFKLCDAIGVEIAKLLRLFEPIVK